MLTDIKNASASFNLLEDGETTVRYFDFSQVYDEITKKTYKIDDIEQYPNINFSDPERSAHFFTLKYKANDLDFDSFI